jgi:hypothetical protein
MANRKDEAEKGQRAKDEVERKQQAKDEAAVQALADSYRIARRNSRLHKVATARVKAEEFTDRRPLTDFAPPPPPRPLPSNHPRYPLDPTAEQYPGLSEVMRTLVRGMENEVRLAPSHIRALRAAVLIWQPVRRLSPDHMRIIAHTIEKRVWGEPWQEPGRSVGDLLCRRLGKAAQAREIKSASSSPSPPSDLQPVHSGTRRISHAAQKLLDTYQTRPPIPVQAMANKIGCSKTATERALRELRWKRNRGRRNPSDGKKTDLTEN